MVQVKWKDTYTLCDEPWVRVQEIEEKTTGNMECYTVGYVYAEKDGHLILGMSRGEDPKDDWGQIIGIPTGMILELIELKPDVGESKTWGSNPQGIS